MRRTEVLQEIRVMRFEEAYFGWSEDRLTQEEAALILGVSDRTFRRYISRYEENGVAGLMDKRLARASFRRAPVDEVMALVDRYSTRHRGRGQGQQDQLTQFGRAMKSLGIQMIAAYSPEARGRSERAFGTHQDRLVAEDRLWITPYSENQRGKRTSAALPPAQTSGPPEEQKSGQFIWVV